MTSLFLDLKNHTDKVCKGDAYKVSLDGVAVVTSKYEVDLKPESRRQLRHTFELLERNYTPEL